LLSLQSGQSTIDSMLFHTAGKLWRVSCQSGRTYSKLMYSVKGKEKKNCFVCPFALVVNTLWASTQQCRRLNKFPISKDRGKWPFAERSAIDTHNSSAAYYIYSRLFLSLSQSQKSMRLLLKALLQAFRETLFRKGHARSALIFSFFPNKINVCYVFSTRKLCMHASREEAKSIVNTSLIAHSSVCVCVYILCDR
jgi:hypothetical protein